MPIQEEDFKTRLASSEEDTTKCIKQLLEIEHMVSAKKSILERDKNDGVDYDFDYGTKEKYVPNQFKVRHNHPDIPVVIAQPFWGFGNEKTKLGRDLTCLLKKKTKYHYVGIVKNNAVQSIFYAKSSVVAEAVLNAMDVWEKTETNTIASQYGKKWFTPEMVQKWIEQVKNRRIFCMENGIEIWWKKNNNERFAKLNLYVPMDLVKGELV
jgi:hypothetical protein